MIFDQLCSIAERWLPDLVPLLQEAMVIHFDVVAHEVLPKQEAMDDLIELRESFVLPAPIVAIEDKGGCVLLGARDSMAKGLFRNFMFADCIPVNADMGAYAENDGTEAMEALEDICPGALIVNLGSIQVVKGNVGQWGAQTALAKSFVGTGSIALVGPVDGTELEPEIAAQTTHSASKNAMTAIEEIIELQRHWRLTSHPRATICSRDVIPRSNAREVLLPVRA